MPLDQSDWRSKSSTELIEALKDSKAYYDKALLQAFDKTNDQGKVITEERAKLLARDATRKAGHEEPEVIRWRLLTLLDPPMYPDRDLTTNPRA